MYKKKERKKNILVYKSNNIFLVYLAYINDHIFLT